MLWDQSSEKEVACGEEFPTDPPRYFQLQNIQAWESQRARGNLLAEGQRCHKLAPGTAVTHW